MLKQFLLSAENCVISQMPFCLRYFIAEVSYSSLELSARVHQKIKVQQMSCMCFSFLSLLDNIFLLKVI